VPAFNFKNEISWMDVMSSLMGIGGILFAVFGIQAGVDGNKVEIDHLKKADQRIEKKVDDNNNTVVNKLETLEKNQQHNYERMDEKLDSIKDHLMRR